MMGNTSVCCTFLTNSPIFAVARIGIKASSFERLLAEDFQVIEINLFAPLPLMLLDKQLSPQHKKAFIKQCTHALALATQAWARSKSRAVHWVFFKTWWRHRHNIRFRKYRADCISH